MKVLTDSNIGLCRAENQDIVKSEKIGDSVFVVLCDGMGGQNSGLDASNITADVVLSKFVAGYEGAFTSNSIRNLMISTVSVANSIVYNTASTDPDKMGMGSTCVAAFVNSQTGMVHIVNVGDSRAYLCRPGKITQITTDHSFVQMLLDRGEITEEEKNDHPKKNMLIRAVGVEKEISVDYFEVELDDARLLLCSDGLHGYCSAEEILEFVNEDSLEDCAEKLVNLALGKGGYDNITLAVVEND